MVWVFPHLRKVSKILKENFTKAGRQAASLYPYYGGKPVHFDTYFCGRLNLCGWSIKMLPAATQAAFLEHAGSKTVEGGQDLPLHPAWCCAASQGGCGAPHSIMWQDPSLATFARVTQGQGNNFCLGKLAILYFIVPTLGFKQILVCVLIADVVFSQAAGMSLQPGFQKQF